MAYTRNIDQVFLLSSFRTFLVITFGEGKLDAVINHHKGKTILVDLNENLGLPNHLLNSMSLKIIKTSVSQSIFPTNYEMSQ